MSPPPLPPDAEPPSFALRPPPPPPPAEKPWWKQIFGPLILAGVLVLKFGSKLKFLILPLLKWLPAMLKTGGTMFLSLIVYAQFWGWKYALGFLLLLLVHEAGHLLAARRMGLDVGAPVFIPFLGASIALKDAPKNAWIEAVVGIGGPILGSLAAGVCQWVFLRYNAPLFGALAYTGYMLNLFNLIPISPLDGGRIAAAISPWLWLIGVAVLAWMLVTQPFNIVLLLVAVCAVPRLRAFFRRQSDEEARYFEVAPAQRWQMGLGYVALAALLAFVMNDVHADLAAWRAGR